MEFFLQRIGKNISFYHYFTSIEICKKMYLLISVSTSIRLGVVTGSIGIVGSANWSRGIVVAFLLELKVVGLYWRLQHAWQENPLVTTAATGNSHFHYYFTFFKKTLIAIGENIQNSNLLESKRRIFEFHVRLDHLIAQDQSYPFRQICTMAQKIVQIWCSKP